MPHNGGRSQTNFWFLQICGLFPFINHLLTAQSWSGNTVVADPDDVDANGYPLTIGDTPKTVCDIPSASEYSGTWVCDWLGTGTIDINSDITTVSGSLSGTDGEYRFTNNETAVGGGNNFGIQISATSGSDHIRQLRVYRLDQRTQMLAGETWNPVFVQKLIDAKIGVLRFLNWQVGGQGNLVNWADRRPMTYINYDGTYWKSSIWVGSTGGSGNAYTCSAPGGFSLVDKAQVIVRFNRTGSGTSGYTMNVGGTGAKRFTGEYGPIGGISGTYDFFIEVIPTNTCLACITYDAALDCWIIAGGGDSNHGIDNGVPPEAFVDLCNRVGAHPWLCLPMMALDARSNYTTQLATYMRDNLDTGLIPRFEPSNEVWNTAMIVTGYANSKAEALWGDTDDCDNWYGKVASTSGQDVSAVYSADRTKYQMIFGVHQANDGYLGDRLAATKYVSINGGQPASSWVTHLAMTTYWYTTNSDVQNIAAGAAYVAAVGAPAKLAIATTYVTTSNTNSGAAPSESIPWLLDLMDSWAAVCTTYSLTLTFYEGGFGTDYYEDANHHTLNDAAKDVHELYNQTMTVYNAAYAKGGEFPSLYLMAGTSGYSALSPTIYDTSPSWDAVSDFNNEDVEPPEPGTGIPLMLTMRLRLHA